MAPRNECRNRHPESARRLCRRNELETYRRHRALTRKQVTQLLGLRAASTVSRLETGRIVPSLITALKLEILYRRPVAFLYPALYAALRQALRAQEEGRASEGRKAVA